MWDYDLLHKFQTRTVEEVGEEKKGIERGTRKSIVM